MFRIKRTRWISLGLVLAVLLLPFPASAGGLWETAAQSWEGVWADLIDWVVEISSGVAIDPNGGQAPQTGPAVDPNG